MDWNYKSLIMAVFSVLLVGIIDSPYASAQSQNEAYVGFLYGLSVPDAESANPHHFSGIVGSTSLTPLMSLGGYYLQSSSEQGKGGRNFDYSIHGLEGALHRKTNLGDTFYGIRVGLSKVRTKENGQETIFSPYHYGVVAGHDRFIYSWLVLGFEGSFLQFQKSENGSGNNRVIEDQFNIIAFMASIKFRL